MAKTSTLTQLQAIVERARETRLAAAEALKGDIRELQEQRDALDATIRTLQDQVSRLEFHAPMNGTGRKGKARKRKTAGGRRSREEMKAEAERMVEYIRKAGKDGASGADLKKEFGPFQSFRQFIKQKTGITVKTKGAKAGMRYFVSA